MTANSIYNQIQKNQPQIKNYCHKYGIEYLGLFGSVARKEKRYTNDIDILVRFDKPKGLGFISIKNDLSRLFKQRVDLVTEKALHPLLKDKILKEVITIYENK
jgi:hypothetical protein